MCFGPLFKGAISCQMLKRVKPRQAAIWLRASVLKGLGP